MAAPFTIRPATPADIPALVALNHLAYPELVADNVVWSDDQLRSHLHVFPDGQIVAEADGRILGAVSSLIVDLGMDPLRWHTWAGITDNGYFTNHDPRADTLYGADVYVHPEARGRGVGGALYEARRQLCRRLNLRRILSGGRLWHYHQYAERYSAEEYVRRVVAGQIRDLVLSYQLREGFVVRNILPNYLPDPNSRNYATLIEWLNPEYRPTDRHPRNVRVACVQYAMRRVSSFVEFTRQVEYFVNVASEYRADFVLLPELFTSQLLTQVDALTARDGIRRLAELTPQVLDAMRALATRHGLTLIAGSTPVASGDTLHNVSHACLPDGSVVAQPKLHITPAERQGWGVTGGDTLSVISTPKAKIGILVCYDVEFPETARHLTDEGAEILFVPFATDNRQAYMRVRHCAQARAIENQVYVAMAGNVGNLPDVPNMEVNYAQAAVLTPADFAFPRDGVKAEADANVETILLCDLDLDDLVSARRAGSVTPRIDRRVDLFRQVATLRL
jgi:predicted amidohydrolase/ribosomal protein S18 acetylase RimI-like enzyme